MARTFTLGALVTRCKQRADAEGDTHVSDSEWKALISEKYGELHGVVADAGLAHFESTADITATGAASYPLNAAVLALTVVEFIVDSSSGRRRALKLLMPQERSRWAGATGEATRYAFTGSSIELWPRPSSGTYRVTYIPQSTDLSSSADATEVDVVTPDGEAFLIWGVAAMAKDKCESDLRFAAQQSEAAKVRLQQWALNRALHEPIRRVVETADADPRFDPQDSWYWPQ